MRLLAHSEWLIGCCYVVARIFRMVARLTMQLLGGLGWLLGCCYPVTRVLGMVARVLLSSY